MSWYVLACRSGCEENILRDCRKFLPLHVLTSAFTFQSERLWRIDSSWKLVNKRMFPGCVFLESTYPELLAQELNRHQKKIRILEEGGLVSVYDEEEQYLLDLCGEGHFLKMSYGYRELNRNYITKGPLKGRENQLIRLDWHRRFAQVAATVAGKRVLIWAGIGLDENAVVDKKETLFS